jgi:protein-S-isoprenylcysteine O-methyltransferase Ste14
MISKRQLKKIIILPILVTVLIPAVLLGVTGYEQPWTGFSPLQAIILIVVGLVLIAIGVALTYKTILLFDRHGDGTLAPWDPPKNLVVLGPYRYVRNPMMCGMFILLVGEALVVGAWALFVWSAIFILGNLAYISYFEEPGLKKRFGKAYKEYCYHVPRWLPRFAAWEPDGWGHHKYSRLV